jgi:hypothetical protein
VAAVGWQNGVIQRTFFIRVLHAHGDLSRSRASYLIRRKVSDRRPGFGPDWSLTIADVGWYEGVLLSGNLLATSLGQ